MTPSMLTLPSACRTRTTRVMCRSARPSRMRLQQQREGSGELIVMSDDRSATLRATTKATRSRQVACIGRVERVEVPRRPTRMRHVLAEPGANGLLFVPEMNDARIGHAITIPAVAAIPIQHVEPDRVHAQVGGGVVAQNVVLDPTGPLPALGSSRRYEQQEPGLAHPD